MSATNDITGYNIQTKPASEAYREGHERIFRKPPTDAATVTPDAATVVREYQHIGTENDSNFTRPQGRWVRFNINRSGTKEVWCDHKLKKFYTVYSD